MKIVKEPGWHGTIECSCSCKFEYEHTDVIVAMFGPYVKCPRCYKTHILVKFKQPRGCY